MAATIEIRVPDIGDFKDVEVIEVLVKAGDSVTIEQPLITLESDKASIDIPSPSSGTIEQLLVQLGDRVNEGNLIAALLPAQGDSQGSEDEDGDDSDSFMDIGGGSSSADSTADDPESDLHVGFEQMDEGRELHCEVLVLGAGPGGYTAAFRSADLGQKTILVERYPDLGGVCLNVGCIPSKALLHTAEVITSTQAMADHGVGFGELNLDIEKLSDWKNSVVSQLTRGLAGLARQRKVDVVHGTGRFSSENTLDVDTEDSPVRIHFKQAIIAAGSQAVEIPIFPNDDPRLMDSTDALALENVPKRLLVVGGGIIGLEMACVYSALGSQITVVELLDGLIPGCDRDIVRPLQKHIEKRYENIFLKTKVTAIESADEGLKVHFEGPKAPESDIFDKVLVAVGRTPNGNSIGAENAGVKVTTRGFIEVDKQQRTNVAHIFAIGDITGQPMLAHKATHEAKVAAEVCAGHKAAFEPLTIPSVAYTDPEVAWAGLTEEQAKADKVEFDKASFPWAASGRALGNGRSEGVTKVIFDKQTRRILGAGICGQHAGDLIAEATLAIEMGADALDIGLTIHPHPTLSETINFAAEMVEGTITDLYIPKK